MVSLKFIYLISEGGGEETDRRISEPLDRGGGKEWTVASISPALGLCVESIKLIGVCIG